VFSRHLSVFFRHIHRNCVFTDRMHKFAIILITIAMFAAGCATTSEVDDEDDTEIEEIESVLDVTFAESIDIDLHRSRLSDHYINFENEIPDVFKINENDQTNDDDSGFRIQLVSTNDRMLADSVAMAFDMWADTAEVAGRPISYIQFRQPVYRVHVGDFLNRSVAIEYLRMIRRYFPGAWIVHDSIDTGSLLE
jgi:hypothetical protein